MDKCEIELLIKTLCTKKISSKDLICKGEYQLTVKKKF